MVDVQATADATLSGLTIEPGEMISGFWGVRTSFALVVGHAVDAVTVTATTTDARATLAIQGKSARSGAATGPIAIDVGRTVIEIVVTAADGRTQVCYEIRVQRGTARPNWAPCSEGGSPVNRLAWEGTVQVPLASAIGCTRASGLRVSRAASSGVVSRP